jgi:DNA modification methylase
MMKNHPKNTQHVIAVVYRHLAELSPDPQNPRTHKDRQINALARSIKALGFNMPLAVDATGKILCGHARYLAAQKLGMSEVPVIRLDHLSKEQAKAFMLADNKLSEMSDWNKGLSAVDLTFDIEATGFSVGEIDLILDLDPQSSDGADRVPEITAGPPITQLGDLWLMGEHRLLCGNAQAAPSYEILMAGKLAAMIITDAPFNVKIQGHVGGKGAIKHREFEMASGEMSSPQFTQFLKTAFEHLVAHSKPGSIHMTFMDWRHLPEILAAGLEVYTSFLNLCVWVKNQAGMGSLYRSQHELCLIFKNGKESHQNNVQLGRFGRYRTNVWQYGGIQTMRSSEEGDLLAMHPTVKPIKMIADAILDCSKRRDIILDPFIGSGTAILACERTGRHCYGMELDPVYVDTAIVRWQNLTGEDAIHAVTGLTFTQHTERSLTNPTVMEVSHD